MNLKKQLEAQHQCINKPIRIEICCEQSLYSNVSIRMCPIKLMAYGMINQMNNTSRNTVSTYLSICFLCVHLSTVQNYSVNYLVSGLITFNKTKILHITRRFGFKLPFSSLHYLQLRCYGILIHAKIYLRFLYMHMSIGNGL